MRNVKLTIAYDGTAYKGWQVQKNGRTVQAEIEKAIARVIGSKHTVHGAGRTDAGVHAIAQVANFKAPINFDVARIPPALNTVLPGDIAVKKAEEVPPDFHSRFDARAKVYSYRIVVSRARDPFSERYVWRLPYALDERIMREEARVLIGKHDFKSFQASDKRERSSVRTIKSISIQRTGSNITLDIEGDGFLYNMVRSIAGTLVDIGRGYLLPGSMTDILASRDRKKAGPTAPAKGLFLVKVKY